MQVFKAYFKIINNMKRPLIIFTVLFISLPILFIFINDGSDNEYTSTECKIAFINYDAESMIVDGLREYLGKYNKIVEIEDEEKVLQDSLFYREVEYIIKVPEGFAEDFMEGREAVLTKRSVPDSYSGYYVELLINKYLNTAMTYIDIIPDITETELINLTVSDLENVTEVILKRDSSLNSVINSCNFYYNFTLYSIILVILFGVSSVMSIFLNGSLKARNTASPLKQKSFQTQMILGNLLYTFLVWAVYTVAAFILFEEVMMSLSGILLMINSLICAVTVLSIGFLVSNIIKSKRAVNSAANLIGLGSAFLGGAFVGQELLSSSILKAASFTPGYWYVKANNEILKATHFGGEALESIIGNILIQAGFAVMFLVLALVYAKNKRVGKTV